MEQTEIKLIEEKEVPFLESETNHNKCAKIRELGAVDIVALKEKVISLSPEFWDFHYRNNPNPNVKTVLNEVMHITFKFSEKHPVCQYFYLPIWEEWKDLLLPVLQAATKPYGYEHQIYPRMMLAKLPAASRVLPHQDGSIKYVQPHKIHVPITTNEKSFFFLEGESFHFKEGVAYEVNNAMNHCVLNNGTTDRIHLIFECLEVPSESINKIKE